MVKTPDFGEWQLKFVEILLLSGSLIIRLRKKLMEKSTYTSRNDFRDLIAYKKAYQLAMEIFKLSRGFPKEELYSLTDQVRRASRSVCANLAESYRKRIYPKNFISKLSDSDAECAEVLVFIEFAKDCGYINDAVYMKLDAGYLEVGRLIGYMIQNPGRFGGK